MINNLEPEMICNFVDFLNSQIEFMVFINFRLKKAVVHLKNVLKRVIGELWGVNIGLNVMFVGGELEVVFGVGRLVHRDGLFEVVVDADVDGLFVLWGERWGEGEAVEGDEHLVEMW